MAGGDWVPPAVVTHAFRDIPYGLPVDLRIPPLRIKIMLESSPLESRICMYIYIYIYIYIYVRRLAVSRVG